MAQPLLRALLIVEHTGCSQDGNGLTNTRTTLTSLPIRLLMWNMPYHAEHHLYASIPFHQLPALHMRIRENLTHIAPGYVGGELDCLPIVVGCPSGHCPSRFAAVTQMTRFGRANRLPGGSVV